MEKKFKKNSQYTIWGIISLALCVPLGLLTRGAGSALVFVGILQLTQPRFPLQFFFNYFTFKASNLYPLKNVKYIDIVSIEYLKKRIIVCYQRKKVRIDKGVFMSNDWDQIINTFKQIKP